MDSILVPRKYTEAGKSLSDLLSEAYDKIAWLEDEVKPTHKTLTRCNLPMCASAGVGEQGE